jgi:tRNA (mo5U34)-methyltransferase
MMVENDMKERIKGISWYHSIELKEGLITEGILKLDFLKKTADAIFNFDLKGKSVLDIGAWDGFYSFEAKRRGARKVLATDHFCWSGEGWGTKEGFDLARDALALEVEDMDIDVMEITPERIGQFDVVLFLGVFYHLKNPFLALESISKVCKEVLVLESHLDLLYMKRPVMAFYPGDTLSNDPTNWWGPNVSLVKSMLQEVGFKKILYKPAPRLSLVRNMLQKLRVIRKRGIFHAFK